MVILMFGAQSFTRTEALGRGMPPLTALYHWPRSKSFMEAESQELVTQSAVVAATATVGADPFCDVLGQQGRIGMFLSIIDGAHARELQAGQAQQAYAEYDHSNQHFKKRKPLLQVSAMRFQHISLNGPF